MPHARPRAMQVPLWTIVLTLIVLVSGSVTSTASAAVASRLLLSTTATTMSNSVVVTSIKVRIVAKRTSKYRTVKVTLQPKGRGKTVVKKARATWSPKAKAYVVKVKLTSRTPGKVTVASKGVRKVSQTTRQPTTAITGWSTKTAVAKVGGTSTRVTVKVTPAAGRVLVLERRTGATWRSAKSIRLKNAKSAKVTVSLPAASTAKTDTWRLRVPSSSVAAGVATAGKIITTTLTGSAGTGTEPVGRDCRAQSGYTDLISDEMHNDLIPGCNGWGPATIPAISTVLDHPGLDDRCGLTTVCWRAPTATEQAQGMLTNRVWSPAPVVTATLPSSTTTETVYLPDMVESLNTYASERGLITQAEIDQYGPAFREMGTSTWTGPTETTPSGLTVVGQGGPSQEWARTTTQSKTMQQFEASPLYSSEDVIGRHSPSGSIAASLNSTNQVPGYTWSCGEQIWRLDSDGTSMKIIRGLPGSAGHYNGYASNVTNFQTWRSRGYVAPTYVNMGAVRYPNGGGVVVMNFCSLSDPVHKYPSPTDPDISYGLPGTLPGDPYAN